MKPPEEEIQARMDRFTEALRSSGVRMTHQRMEIFREVASTGEHPDAETVFGRVRKRMPTLSLDTVYRTLWMLDGMGLIDVLATRQGRVRFDANALPHHHFVCAECDGVRDFYSKKLDDLEVPASVSRMGEVKTAHVHYRGICNSCQEKKGK